MNIQPELIERRCGGWLAVTPRCVAIRIGAVGESAEEASANFNALIEQWAQARAAERKMLAAAILGN